MIGADTALTGIMRETALSCPGVQRAHGVGLSAPKLIAEMLKTDAEYGLAQSAPPMVSGFRAAESLRRHRMMHPFVTLAIDVFLGAERPLVELHLGALIDQRAGIAGERHAVLLALEEVLPHLRANFLEQETDMRRDRIVAQNGVVLLQQIANAEQRERAEDHDRDQQEFPRLRVMVENPDADQHAVTTAQIVSTMKRGENGSSIVSMEPSAGLFWAGGSLV